MPVPKRKRSRSRRDKRFANKGMKVKTFTECANCQSPLATHQVCSACGFYKGKKIMVTKAERAVKRGEERQARSQKQGQREKTKEASSAKKVQEPSIEAGPVSKSEPKK